MPCDKRELLEAFEEGIRVMELTAPVEVVGQRKGRRPEVHQDETRKS